MRKLENLKEGFGWVPSIALVCTMILNELKETDLSIVCFTNIARTPIHDNAFLGCGSQTRDLGYPQEQPPHQPEMCVIYGKH